MINAGECEAFMIPYKFWSEDILSQFPQHVRDFLDEGQPTGIGHHNEAGWFCVAAGQGPCIVWTEHDVEIER